MAKSKRSKSSEEDERRKLVGNDRAECLANWRTKLNTTDRAQRTLNLHAVMYEVQKLKTQYSDVSVDAVLSKIFPDRSKRARLKRLHEIPKNVLQKAMTAYRKSRNENGYKGSMCILSTTHLEFLGVCKDAENRIALLNQCASKGWTVVQIKAAVKAASGSKTVRPLDLAKRIRAQTKQLKELLKSVTEKALVESVTKVKVENQQEAIKELKKAGSDLSKLARRLDAKSVILTDASVKLKKG